MTGTTVSVERLLATSQWTLRDIIGLRHTVRQIVPERQRLEEYIHKGAGFPVATAVIDWVLDRKEPFEEAATTSSDSLIMLLHSINLAENGQTLAGWQLAEKAAKGLPDPWTNIVLAELALVAHQPDAAASRIEKLSGEYPNDPHVIYLAGRLKEEQLLWQEALECYERAVSQAPDFAPAAFRRAYLLELRGMDAEAIQAYQAAATGRCRFAGAMINLGLLYEEQQDIERAIACFQQAARSLPGSHHARVLLEGAVEATQELFDEAERKEMERIQKLLRTPVSEFELSVRSRNCLSRMGVRTLWDLVQKTEEELLAHKNFGEVSLREMKQLLSSRGLRLGMRRDLGTQKVVREMLAAAVEGTATNPRLLAQPVSSLELSSSAAHAVERLGVKTLGELIQYTKEDLSHIPSFGQALLDELCSRLAQVGLSFKDSEEAVVQEEA